MQGTIFKRVRHECAKGKRRWVRLPNKPPKEPLVCPACIEPEEIARLLDATKDPRDQTILYLFTYSGLRRGELFGLRWSDLDEHTNRLRVRRSLFQGEVTRPKTTHSERTVDIPESIVNRLRAYRETDPPLKKGYMFHSHTGSPMDPDNWYKRVFVPTAERAGLRPSERDEDDGPAVGIHTLRHTYASLLINQSESIKYGNGKQKRDLLAT